MVAPAVPPRLKPLPQMVTYVPPIKEPRVACRGQQWCVRCYDSGECKTESTTPACRKRASSRTRKTNLDCVHRCGINGHRRRRSNDCDDQARSRHDSRVRSKGFTCMCVRQHTKRLSSVYYQRLKNTGAAVQKRRASDTYGKIIRFSLMLCIVGLVRRFGASGYGAEDFAAASRCRVADGAQGVEVA